MMLSAKPSNKLYVLLALALALDQRIEWQLPAVLVVTMLSLRRSASVHWQPGKTIAALVLAGAYIALNTAIMFMDAPRLSEAWWQAPIRIWLFFLLLSLIVPTVNAQSTHPDAPFRVIEWLFVVKLLLIVAQGLVILRTGMLPERPLFNIIISPDALLGVRFTSSYDFLFCLLALSPIHQIRRVGIIAAIVIISETRLVFLLSGLFLAWRLLGSRKMLQVALTSIIPIGIGVAAVSQLAGEEGRTPRVTQISGSSLDDKLEQMEAVGKVLQPRDLIAGRGLGMSLGNIIRDEARPYSYEAQVPVLIYQGGLLFFLLYTVIVSLFVKQRLFTGLGFIFLFATLNPTLFSAAAAYFLGALPYCLNRKRRHVELGRVEPTLAASAPART